MHARRSMKLFTTTAAALLLLSGACAQRARFQPTDNTNAVSPSGQPAASYELRIDQTSAPGITVNVWSDGASRHDDRTIVKLSVEVRNTGDQPVQLDRNALALETFNTDGTPLPAGRLTEVTAEKGSYEIPPHSASTLKLRFEVGPVAPDQIGALRFRWGVLRSDGERYVQFTEFRRQPEYVAMVGTVYYDPIFGFYDPFFYGPPYGFHSYYYVPVRRVVIEHRSRPAVRRR
jgi:hypothetical protein